MKFPTIKEMAEEVAEKALDEFEYKGKTLRQWIEIILATDNNVGTKLGTNLAEVGTDCISRQAAIDALKNRWRKTRNYEGIGDDIAEECELYLKQLPSAQPEPSWECEKCMMEHTDEMEKLEAELAIAKSKQPEPCEDAVSRQTLKDGFTEMCNLICPYTKKRQHVMCGSCLMGTAFDVLEATPSVTPKQRTGHWILDRSGAYCCSECMEPCASYVMMKPRDKFCKMCGSRNEVTT